jgi:hypothetical protein
MGPRPIVLTLRQGALPPRGTLAPQTRRGSRRGASRMVFTTTKGPSVTCAHQGNVEYKLHLINPSPTRFVRLVTQMKWRLLEGGGQAIYELGVADSGALVGLSPGDLCATLKTLRAMATEIGARVIIAKKIEVVGSSDTSVAAADFRSSPHKRNGSKDNPRTAVKNLSRFQTSPAESDSSPRSFVSTASMTFSSSVDSTSSSTTDSHSPVLLSSPPSPLPPTQGPLGDHETVHDDNYLFPTLTLDEPHRLPHGLADGEKLLLSSSQSCAIAVPKSPVIRIQSGYTAPQLRDVPHSLGVESQCVHADGDEPLLTALGKLEIADNSRIPGEGKRMIVEATIIRELDQEEGFLDFSSF